MNESKPVFAYKRYAQQKSVIQFLAKTNHFANTNQLIKLAYFAFSRNENLFANEKLTKLLSRNF